jgi:hypothetical protein
MLKLEIILLSLLTSCTHLKNNFNYLKNLQTEIIFNDTNGTYSRTIDPKGNCFIEFEPLQPLWSDSLFGQPHSEKLETMIYLHQKYCSN